MYTTVHTLVASYLRLIYAERMSLHEKHGKHKQIPPIGDLLRETGLKATPGRIELLQFLRKEQKPLTVKEIVQGLRGALDQVTVYRALEALTLKGVIRKVDMRHPHAHYEMVIGREHHHHLICTLCERVEDVAHCETGNLEYQVLRSSKEFTSIESHALEFYGVCKKCST